MANRAAPALASVGAGLVATGISKVFVVSGRQKVLYEDLSFAVRKGEKLAVLGRNGQGKSTLIKILGGVTTPTRGRVDRRMSVSWPIGFAGGFQGSLTGFDNVLFISRIYGRPFEDVLSYVEWFSELGEDLLAPVKTYSSGMRARLAFGLSLAIEFDCYLIDEVMAVGDSRFTERSQSELFDRRKDRAFVIASHDIGFLQRTCDRAIIIHQGRAKIIENIDVACEIYMALD